MNRTEHLLTIAGEECAEVAQRCSKAARFGMEQIQQDADDKPEENPERLTNAERIRREYSDLAAVLEMLGIGAPLGKWMDEKKAGVEKYLVRSAKCGTLEPEARPSGATCQTCVKAEAAISGCNALIGLIQLVCSRDDMPPEIKKALLCSPRMDEALAALRHGDRG